MSRRTPYARASASRHDVPIDQILGVLERARSAPLSEADYGTLRAAVDTLALLTHELAARGTSIERLRKMLFGASTEKTRNIVGTESTGGAKEGGEGQSASSTTAEASAASEDKPKVPGHGRNGADAYTGATKVHVPHESLHGGDVCPCCERGKVYPTSEPGVLLRIRGMAPLAATRYERERFRCGLCGETFTAKAPEGVGEQKFDESAGAMIGITRYGTGVPFHRVEKLQGSLGVPLPASTQWDVVEAAAKKLESAHDELIRQAAQGEVLHNDDTTMTVLELAKAAEDQRDDDLQATPSPTSTAPGPRPKSDAAPARGEARKDEKAGRTGVFTTGIVARQGEHKIALFFTGRQHAGENLADVLSQRAANLPPPIQMCDALTRNLPNAYETILSNCMAHGRRYFVDVFDAFPKECEWLLGKIGEVYKYDAEARKERLSPEKRLQFHQENSQPVMDEIHGWLKAQITERKVEPNSGLGEAIAYMRKHWKELTLFLRVAGAPLDNNICERALKKAILHRKNSLYYKTQHGADVGDCFMSLIHTCELNRVNPFEYLVALQKHHRLVAANPSAWMPWNYTEVLRPIGPLLVT